MKYAVLARNLVKGKVGFGLEQLSDTLRSIKPLPLLDRFLNRISIGLSGFICSPGWSCKVLAISIGLAHRS